MKLLLFTLALVHAAMAVPSKKKDSVIPPRLEIERFRKLDDEKMFAVMTKFLDADKDRMRKALPASKQVVRQIAINKIEDLTMMEQEMTRRLNQFLGEKAAEIKEKLTLMREEIEQINIESNQVRRKLWRVSYMSDEEKQKAGDLRAKIKEADQKMVARFNEMRAQIELAPERFMAAWKFLGAIDRLRIHRDGGSISIDEPELTGWKAFLR